MGVSDAAESWQEGQRISVRGQVWTVLEATRFTDCEALRLSGAEGESRTILLPFDRARRLDGAACVDVIRPRRWLRTLYGLGLEARPYGGVSAAVSSNIEFLPFQLEPALAALGDGFTRILIADEVGLGKTIQAGLILRQLAAESGEFRGLIVSPASLREQWVGELAARFGIDAVFADSSWLRRAAGELPADVNPWSLPGIYIASFDFLKRPEVLLPFERIEWDALVVDEAHAAALGTARRAAVHAVATRARRVILLSATPHSGDAEAFRALCRIGGHPQSPPLLIFRRSRADARTAAPRRSVLLPVRLSEAERRMHRLLEAYTAQVCAEARARGDAEARLAAMVLRKRALSSAGSLAISCRRRLALLSARPVQSMDQQLLLPLGEEEPIDDDEPGSILAVPGLSDTERELRWLIAVAESADVAASRESKIALLSRLLRRLREPALVFTEYRDTLERIRVALAGSHHDAITLHGGMGPAERSRAQHAFNESGTLLLATDAASEGLNLHHRCRLVIHFELPWNPARLEQRTGRVDRIGQSRVVHEIVLVASDTAERLVLAPLARRAARARGMLAGRSGLIESLAESRVAATVMEGMPLEPATASLADEGVTPSPDLRIRATAEAARLNELRAWRGRATGDLRGSCVGVTLLNSQSVSFPDGLFWVFSLSLTEDSGRVCHREIAAVHDARKMPATVGSRAGVRALAGVLISERLTEIQQVVRTTCSERIRGVMVRHAEAAAALADRQRAVAATSISAARALVQVGLFDRQVTFGAVPSGPSLSTLLDDDERRDHSSGTGRLTLVVTLSGLLLVSNRRRP